MPTTPKSITIEFVAQDKGLRKELQAISDEQQKLNKVTQKAAQTQEGANKQLSELNKKLSDNFRAMEDVERQQQRELKATIKGKDARRSSSQALKDETTQRKSHLNILKQDIINRSKAAEIAKKQAKANQILSTTINTNRSQLKRIEKQLKSVGANFGKAGVSAGVLKQALRGNSKAMATASKASKVLIKDLKKVNTGLFSITNNGRLVVGSFATIRSKMLLASFAASLVSKAFVSNVEAFGKQQDSVQRLASVFGGEGATSLADYASELQKVTTFGDENINAAMAQMGAFGASTEQTKSLTKATLDLSAGMGIDLNTAALLVAKSFGTSTNALGRYGVELDSSMTKEEKVAAITAKVEERYGGLAKQLAQTTSGQLAQARNAFGDLGENIGAVLAPAVLMFAKGLKIASEALNPKVIGLFAKAIITLTAAYYANRFAAAAASSGVTIYSTATKIATTVTNGLTKAMKLLKAAFATSPFGAVAAGVTLLAGAFLAWKTTADETNYIIDENGKKVKKLTEEEIKLRQAILDNEEALMKKLALLKATSEAEKQAITLGRALSQTEINLMEEIKNLTDAKSEEEAFTRRMEAAYNSLIDVKIENMKADLAELELRHSLMSEAEDGIVAMTKAEMTYEALTKRLNELIKKRDEDTKSTNENHKAIESSEKSLTKQRAALEKRLELDKNLKDGLAALNEEEKVKLEFGDAVTDLQIQEAQAIDAINQRIKEQLELREIQNEMREFAMEQITAAADHEISEAQRKANEKIAAIDREEKQQLDALRNTWLYKKMTDKQKAIEEKKITDDAAQQRKAAKEEANRDMEKAFKFKQQLDIVETIMATKTAVMKTLAAGAGFFSTPQAMWVAAFGAMQVAAIAAQKPPKMQYGGLVGGNRHSQGGTMVEAERGEYVVSRAGVQATGIETLNRINAGELGGGGGTSIVINNPILGKDTIEDEIVPQIQEALRRGHSL